MHSPVRSLWAFIYFSTYSDIYLFALKPFKFTYMEMKKFEKNTFPPYEAYKFLACFSLPTSPLTPPLVMTIEYRETPKTLA
jgi:hypothetical protein